MATKQNSSSGLRLPVLRVMRVHFLYMLAYAIGLIIFDTWNLIEHQGVFERWTLVGTVFIVNVMVWYLARNRVRAAVYYKLLIMALVVADIVFAAVNIYWERGMASRYVALLAVPIVVSAVLASRRAILATAALCVAAYAMTVTRYFYEHYGEGFKVELYGVIFFYSALSFILAGFLWAALKPKSD